MGRFRYDHASGLMVPAERGRIVHRAPRLMNGSAQQGLIAAASGAASDPNFSSVDLLLLFQEGAGATTFIDSSSHARTVTTNGSVVGSATANAFGYASCGSFPGGAGNYLNATVASITPSSTTPWTLEMWVNLTAGQIASTATMAAFSASGTSFYWESYPAWNSLYVGDGSVNAIAGAAQSTSAATWKHYALTNDGSGATTAYRAYYDGNKYATSTATLSSGAQTTFLIGQGNSATLTGLIGGFRYTNGVARYTGTTYTVPSSQFPTS